MALPTHANHPVLYIPDNALRPSKVFVLSAPRAVHNGSICWTLDAMKMEVFFGSQSQLAKTEIRMSVSIKKNMYIHTVLLCCRYSRSQCMCFLIIVVLQKAYISVRDGSMILRWGWGGCVRCQRVAEQACGLL